MLGLAIAYKPADTTPPSAAGSCAITQPKAATAHSAGAAHPDAATPPATAASRRMPDLATIGLVCRSVDCNLEAAALTTNLTKALFFEKNARKTQNKTRRGRLLRAARRYLLAAAKELESLPRPPASRKKKDHPSGAGLPTQKPTARLGVSSVAPPNARACVIFL